MKKYIFWFCLLVIGGIGISCGLTDDTSEIEEEALTVVLSQLVAENQATIISEQLISVFNRINPANSTSDQITFGTADSDGWQAFTVAEDAQSALISQSTATTAVYKVRALDVSSNAQVLPSLQPSTLTSGYIQAVHEAGATIQFDVNHISTRTVDSESTPVTIQFVKDASHPNGVSFELSRASNANQVEVNGLVSSTFKIEDPESSTELIDFSASMTMTSLTIQDYVEVSDSGPAIPSDFCISDISTGTVAIEASVPSQDNYSSSGTIDFTNKVGSFTIPGETGKYCFFFGATSSAFPTANFTENNIECLHERHLSLEANSSSVASPFECVD